MSAAKKKTDNGEKCEACDVLGDYMSCSDMSAGRTVRAPEKRSDEPGRKS